MKMFKLGSYKGLNLKSFDTATTEDDIDRAIEYLINNQEEVQVKKKGGIETGDHVVVHLEGLEKKTGLPIIGALDDQFVIGEDPEKFPEEFVDCLIGKRSGEVVSFDKSIHVNPVDFRFHELSGRDLTFNITIKKVYSLEKPQLTDKLVKELDPRADSIEDLKLLLVEEIHQQKVEQEREGNINIVIQAVIDQSEYEFDEEALDKEGKKFYYQFASELADVDEMKMLTEYLTQRQITADILLDECKEEVAKQMLRNAIMDAVIEAENIVFTSEEYELLKKKHREDQENEQLPKELSSFEMVKTLFLRRKALDFLLKVNFID